MKKLVIAIIGINFLFCSFAFGQDTESKQIKNLDVSVDLMSRYVWRGTDFGQSPSIQPGLSYSLKGFVFGGWGAFTTNNPGIQEADLYLSYNIKDVVTLSLTDYFFPNELASNQRYFYYGDSTEHVFEASFTLNQTDKIPFSILLAMNFYGGDAYRINSDGSQGSIQYSSYAELSYAYKNLNAFVGFNITKPNTTIGESGYYGSKPGFVNVGLTVNKDIKISDKYSLPLNVSIITNPQAEKIFLVAGFSF